MKNIKGRMHTMLLCIMSISGIARASAYDGKPKLIVILVFDQFRGDYIERYRNELRAEKGWNLFLRHGSHFTDCYYDYANLVTAPGHASIGTGAYTDGHGIALNEWWTADADGTMRVTTSVEDARYSLVGVPKGVPANPGASPFREMSSTLGDELVLATRGGSRVYGISLKDRAAILTSGHTTRGAFWTDHASGRWISSTYWMSDLPPWVKAFNDGDHIAQARGQAQLQTGSFYDGVGRTLASVRYQFAFAEALIEAENLGNNRLKVPDMITISISSTDINGHAVGPDDESQERLVIGSDIELDRFFSYLDRRIGLNNVMIGMTSDHGVAPSPASAVAMGMPARDFPPAMVTEPLEAALERKWPLKTKNAYILQLANPYLILNPEAFRASGIEEEVAENTARDMLLSIFTGYRQKESTLPSGQRLQEPPLLAHVYTASQMRNGQLPGTQYGRFLTHSYSPYVGWALHINFGAYQFPGSGRGTAHFTANSYDRHVPLELFGTAFIPGTYHDLVAPIDLAATFASVLRINRPSAAEGRVLTPVIKPDVVALSAPATSK